MPVGKSTIVFARMVPSELNIVTTENNNVIDIAMNQQVVVNSADVWQTRNCKFLLWSDFATHFYGGGEKDFGISNVAGTHLTMVGISGEYVNGIPQLGSLLTHIADAAQGVAIISGVSVLNDVIDSVVYDLGLPHEAWDSCSYMNVVEQLNEVHSVADCMRVSGKLQQSCSLKMEQLVHEICSNFDETNGYRADNSASALRILYEQGESQAIAVALNGTRRYVDLVLSIMFKNSTPGVRNVEFRIHLLVSAFPADSQDLTSFTIATVNGSQV